MIFKCSMISTTILFLSLNDLTLPLHFFLEYSKVKENLGRKEDGDFERIAINKIENVVM